MKIGNVYTSVACNRTPTSLDCGYGGLVVFGGHSSICLLDSNYKESSKIIKTFVHHTKPVNCVKWIHESKNKAGFVSGASDGLVILWDISDENNPCKHILSGHLNAVYYIDSIYKDDSIFVASASSDSTIRLWSIKNDNIDCTQILSLEKGVCLSLALSILPKYERILLVEARDNNEINLWVETYLSGTKEFKKIHTLKGHEDWVRGLDFIKTFDDNLMLASSSQDTFIRLWKISPRFNNKDVEIENNLYESDIKIEESLFTVNDDLNTRIVVAISVESVLQGHEGWVYGVQWHKNESGVIKLLSSSMDKTLIIWEFNQEVGVWTEKVRLGEVGGNSLGFFGGKFSANGQSIIAHSFHGGLHIWKQSEDDENMWIPATIVGGHFNEVRDLCWEPNGEFLFSVSADQTTRIHAPFRRKKNEYETWHEIARPQIHGYDMQTIAAISRYKFASGGEEKIIRMFQTTADFIENFHNICKIFNDPEGENILRSLPKGASVPSLGLSNKAVYTCDESNEEKHVKDIYPENYFVSVSLETPPQEETLMQNTLWHEIHKLYGHGFEIYAVTSSSNGKWIASSCKATTAEYAHIYLWDTSTGKQIQKLTSHQLTVTQLKFSPNNKYLLSVSRDRSWSLFENFSIDGIDFQLEAKSDKTNGRHTRIIWACDWSHDSVIFATASRDGKVILWKKSEITIQSSLKNWEALDCLEVLGQSITAICFAPIFYQNKTNQYLIAIGLENGNIQIYSFLTNFQNLFTINQSQAHHLTVKKLQFNPCSNKLLLASCGEDNIVRIIELKS